MKFPLQQYCELLESLLGVGHSVQTRTKGTSMEPTIPDGSVLHVQPVALQDVQMGDIVLIKSASGRPLYHRVVRVFHKQGQSQVQTWGDACASLDAPVPLEHVLGRVTAVESNGVEIDLIASRREALRQMWYRYLWVWWRRLFRCPLASRTATALCSPVHQEDN